MIPACFVPHLTWSRSTHHLPDTWHLTPPAKDHFLFAHLIWILHQLLSQPLVPLIDTSSHSHCEYWSYLPPCHLYHPCHLSPYQCNHYWISVHVHFLCEGHYSAATIECLLHSVVHPPLVCSLARPHTPHHTHHTTQHHHTPLLTTILLWSPHKCQFVAQCVDICGEGRC